MQPNDQSPLELSYAPRGAANGPPLPEDQSVLKGLRMIVAAVVLLPFVAGLVLILLLLFGTSDGWRDELHALFSG